MSGLFNSLKSLAGSSKQSAGEEADMRFSVSPREGASGWAEWLRAMRLVARLPAGIPTDFRRKLWLTLAEQHLKVKGVDWEKAEKTCFSEWTNPDDTELGVQIVKDLHRTGCSLFCGTEGRENQAVLKRVLLAYARWNKNVGYCQGFNMLAALILEVMDRSESDSLKVMIYLIEAVLPEGYFANNLRGLSVDMAVFRDLLRLRLPKLSAHLDKLQKGAAEGSCYEPPLTNVFTMQWFLTLFCNCLPRNAVLRVWDLVFLEGDEFLLTTALAIWATLQDRILAVDSADEFYSVMGELARETLEAPPAQAEELVARAVKLGPVPELPRLRDKHRYNITPWAHTVQSAAKKGLRLFYSEDETDSSDEGDKLAVTTAFGLHTGGRGRGALVAAGVFGHPDRERLALDISALKQQYARLRERQRQAHIILAAACARQPHGSTSGSGPMSVNHLLLGKSAIVSSRGRRLGPPQGSIPPLRTPKPAKIPNKVPTPSKNETLHWKDENHRKSISRRDSIKWKDVPQPESQSEDGEEVEEQEEEGKEVSESEVNEIIQSSMRSRGKSESSSYSECSESSTSTSLCDEPNRMSDFDSEPASVSDNVLCIIDDISKTDMSDDRETVQSDDINNESGDNQHNEKTAAEFGSYIQEFEELLDRTNDIDNDRGLVCVLPDEKKTEEAEFENIEITDQETNESESDMPIEEVSENKFEEFVDSNRGEPLRNYLDEFRKADFLLKQEIPWEAVEPLHIDVFDTIKNATASSVDETDKEEEQTDLDENSTNFELKNPEAHEESSVKSLQFHDYRSTSCDRSISSSISSISPILKTIPQLTEEKASFLSYKSPCRVDSEVVSEISEDEKPLILKIDKYFEHSPEFFGARKSGTYISSDEEDDRFISRTRKKASPLVSKNTEFTYESIDKVQTTCERHIDHIDLSEFGRSFNNSHLDIEEPSTHTEIESKKILISPLKPYKYTEYDHTAEDADKQLGFISPKLLSPIASFNKTSKVLQLHSPQTAISPLKDVLKSPIEIELGHDIVFDKINDHSRLNLLEKTKSEDLPQEHRRSFSILDDEIDAIRSQSGRRNSERALKIIQENSKILHRILVNQVNKSSIRDSFQEEICEVSEEESKHEEDDDKLFKILTKKTHKCLYSPRSSSLDDHLLSQNQKTSPKPAKELSLDLETKPVRSVIYSPQFPSKENLNDDISFRARHLSKKDYVISPISFKIGIPIYEARVTEQTKHYFSKTTPEVTKGDEPLCTEENKTDKFGWENKGFNANQRRLSAVYSDVTSPPKPLIQNLITDYHDTNKSTFVYDIDKEKPRQENNKLSATESKAVTEEANTNDEVNLHLKPVEIYPVTSPDIEKGSTLTAVSEPIVETSEYVAQDYTESWKPENNNSISDSYNVTSPYKFTYKSSDNSIGLDSAFKNLRKFNDSPLSRITDTFSRVTECSPMENIPRPEGFKFETSQSSDICIVSSSMSFSFDPSVEDQQSSKPGTFNSSDTLCQLTSLDQVSTPISPKMTTYSLGKDSTGISQRDLSLELDRFKLTSEDLSGTQGSIADLNSPSISSLKTPTSPTPSQDKTKPTKSPDKAFSPFPMRGSTRQPKELGLRLGLYKDSLKSPSK